jgi:hypothetical protein
LPVADYLRRPDGDAYPYRLAEAITLSLRAVEARDPSGSRSGLMGLVSVLAETGVPRRVLHLAAETGVLGGGAAGADAAAGELADASLVGFSLDDAVVAHRLVMRVERERLAADGGLADVMAGAVQVLAGLTDGMSEAWRDPGGVRDLAQQVSAVVTHSTDGPGAVGEMPADLLSLRLVYLLNALVTAPGLRSLPRNRWLPTVSASWAPTTRTPWTHATTSRWPTRMRGAQARRSSSLSARSTTAIGCWAPTPEHKHRARESGCADWQTDKP